MNIFRTDKYLNVVYRDKNVHYNELLSKWISENVFKKNGTLLDVGCGCGDHLKAFNRLGYDVFGTDISPRRDGFSDCAVERVDLECDNRLIRKSDFVFSKSVIEHIKNVDNAMDFMYNNLNEGGKIVVMTPSWEHIHWGPFYADHTHITPFTKKSLENILKMHDFKDIKIVYFYQLPFVWKYPFMRYFCKLINWFGVPYEKSKLIRFSREVMLFAEATK